MDTKSKYRSDPRFLPEYYYIGDSKPTEGDRQFDATLMEYMRKHMKLEGRSEMDHRNRVLEKLKRIFVNFVKEVAITICKIPEDEAEFVGGNILVSGSHRLGVRDVGADIDTICVAPNFVTREHFFTLLKDEMEKNKDVTDFIPIETAAIPIMSFDFEGVSIDLLFARLADSEVSTDDLDVLNDRILLGVDDATAKSLNGPRVASMIPYLVNMAKGSDGRIIEHDAYTGAMDDDNKFLIVLRCVRKWAKCKGLYGNKMGYLGGINCNLLVALVCQYFPHSSPSQLLMRFFWVYSRWEWPKPVKLNAIQQPPPGIMGEEVRVWTPHPREIMPIITPAYPAMNSSYNVNKHSLSVMVHEFKRGYEVCSKMTKERGEDGWDLLFEPSDFFIRYDHYLCLHILGNGDDMHSRSWISFVEARVLRFPQYLEVLPIKLPIHLFPVQSKTVRSANSICYFVGFNVSLESGKKFISECRDGLDSAIDAFRYEFTNESMNLLFHLLPTATTTCTYYYC